MDTTVPDAAAAREVLSFYFTTSLILYSLRVGRSVATESPRWGGLEGVDTTVPHAAAAREVLPFYFTTSLILYSLRVVSERRD